MTVNFPAGNSSVIEMLHWAASPFNMFRYDLKIQECSETVFLNAYRSYTSVTGTLGTGNKFSDHI